MPYPTYSPYYTGTPRYNYGYQRPVTPVTQPYMYPDPAYGQMQSTMPGRMNGPARAVQPVQTARPRPQPQGVQANSPFPSRIWVTGIEGAKGFQISPNTKVMLMDSERNKFYIKSANADGVPSIEAYSYQKDGERANSAANAVQMDMADIITKKDFEALEGHLAAKYDDIISAINSVRSARENRNDKKK